MQSRRNADRPAVDKSTTIVLLITGSLQGGGAERVLCDMANYWSIKGWDVYIATWSGRDSTDFYELTPEVRRVWLDAATNSRNSVFARLGGYIKRVRTLRSLLRELKPTAVLSFIDRSNILTILAASGLPSRITVSERTNPESYTGLSGFWRFLRRRLYRRADCVVAQTEDAAGWVQRQCDTKACTIPNPLRNLPELRHARENLILSVGRISRAKGFDLLLHSFARISVQFPDWRIDIVGSGPEKAELQQLRDELGLTSSVSFHEPTKNIELMMSRAGLVVQPSRLEGFPNVVLEAMGMGAAVIAANCRSGPSELIEDGINGRLVPVDDVETLAAAMADLMSHPDLRSKIGDRATAVREEYRQDVIMARWEACVFPQKTQWTSNGQPRCPTGKLRGQ